MTAWLMDLRYAARSLVRSPSFSIAVILTLGIGIGASTAIYSVVEGVLLRPLPYDDPEGLVMIWGERTRQGFDQAPVTVGDFRNLNENTDAFEGLAAGWFAAANLSDPGSPPEKSRQGWVTDRYFDLLDITPARGRLFSPGERDAAVITDGLWRRRYGTDPGLIGSTITVNERPVSVVGILPPGADPNIPTLGGVRHDTEIWRIMPASWLSGNDRLNGWLRVFGRLDSGATVDEANRQAGAVARDINSRFPEKAAMGFGLNVISMLDDIVGRVSTTIWVLSVAVGLVLLVACANVANLVLVRGGARSRELTVRGALGAGRVAIARVLLSESFILAAAGGVLGLFFAVGAVSALARLAPSGIPRMENVGVDAGTAAFALFTALLSTVLFGLVPAIQLSRQDLSSGLRARSSSSSRGTTRIRNVLIVGEVSLTVVLLVGAGLLGRSLFNLMNTNPGFEPDSIVSFTISAPRHLTQREEVTGFFTGLENELHAIPGVTAVGSTNKLPLGGGMLTAPFTTPRLRGKGAAVPEGDMRLVTPGFFHAMSATLLSGRFLQPLDGPGRVVIDRVLAERYFPDGDAVGGTIITGDIGPDSLESEVVGVVEHMRHEDIGIDGRPTVFFPLEAGVWRGYPAIFAVKTSLPAEQLVPQARELLAAASPTTPLADVRTMDEIVAEAVAPNRFGLMIIAVFAATAAFLAVIGLYGLVSFAVGERRREIGVRLAFGATPGAVIALVLKQGLVLAVIGLIVGVSASLAGAQGLESLLYGVSTMDAANLASIATAVLILAAFASWIPALRATRIDVVEALRSD